MSKLEFYGRPLIRFDPDLKDHRRFYHEFISSGTWGRCPYRFILPDDQGDLVTMIQRRMVSYYISREFAVVSKQQSKKTIDTVG